MVGGNDGRASRRMLGLAERLGFAAAFDAFAGIATLAALVFLVCVPETAEMRAAPMVTGTAFC